MTLEAVFEKEEELAASFGSTTVIASGQYRFGDGLKYDADTRTVSVDAAESVSAGDTRPVTSAAVQVQIGNIEALLQTI